MTNKRKKNKIAREIRHQFDLEFITSIKIAKGIWDDNVVNVLLDLGFHAESEIYYTCGRGCCYEYGDTIFSTKNKHGKYIELKEKELMKVKKNCVIKTRGGSKMSKKVLLSTTRNNGYGCSCCSRTWDDHEWVEKEDMLSFEEVIKKALNCDPYGDWGDTIEFVYEENGEYLYGYDIYVNRSYADIYIWIGEEKYPLKAKDKENLSEEELVKKYKQFADKN